jgi:hypothetical protein
MKTDRRDQAFVDVGEVRLTFVRGKNRAPVKDWAPGDVLRVQAYGRSKKTGKRVLRRGAEIPVGSAAQVLELITAIAELTKPGA